VRRAGEDRDHDVAALALDGKPLPALPLAASDPVREGRNVYFTGFPIGAVLGPVPVTHRAIVAAVTPIALPRGNASQLNAATIRRLGEGTFPVFQLDGTAYPGNSGSPVYDATTGEVLAILNMVLVKATKESMLAQPSGIAYAVPSEHLARLLDAPR
jgi:S1-C subfamily serine protease